MTSDVCEKINLISFTNTVTPKSGETNAVDPNQRSYIATQ